jgi:quinol monooxygenase YgiN
MPGISSAAGIRLQKVIRMIYANIWLTVKEATNVEKVRELLSEQARLSRQEPGCARFEVYQSHNDATKFLLIERWETQESLDVHRTAHAYTTIYQPQILPLVIREPHPSHLVSG